MRTAQRRRLSCRNGVRNGIVGRSRDSPRRCHRSFRRRSSSTLCNVPSRRRCRALRSTRIGERIRCAPTDWPAHSRQGAEHRPDGDGNSRKWHRCVTAAGAGSTNPIGSRVPPAPYRERRHGRGPGFCCICGQPVYRFGWHLDMWDRGPNMNAAWHAACVTAWDLWRSPSDHVRLFKRLQRRRCAATDARLWRSAEVDHRVPLFEVWREHRDMPWPILLGFWGAPNLQVINRNVHAQKCAAEARARRIRTASAPTG